MSTVLSSKILTAKKDHKCDAYNFWISEYIKDIIQELTFKEKRSVVRMRLQKGKILTGQKYIRVVSVFDGDFCDFKADIEMDKICSRLDLYEEI